MYYTLIKHSGLLRTLEKCRKHWRGARVFYISFMFSSASCVLSQCNTRLRLLYFLNIYPFCRGLKAYLGKWKGRGFDNEVKRLIALLEAGSLAQAEEMVWKIIFRREKMYNRLVRHIYIFCSNRRPQVNKHFLSMRTTPPPKGRAYAPVIRNPRNPPPIRALAGYCGTFILYTVHFWFPGRRGIRLKSRCSHPLPGHLLAAQRSICLFHGNQQCF